MRLAGCCIAPLVRFRYPCLRVASGSAAYSAYVIYSCCMQRVLPNLLDVPLSHCCCRLLLLHMHVLATTPRTCIMLYMLVPLSPTTITSTSHVDDQDKENMKICICVCSRLTCISYETQQAPSNPNQRSFAIAHAYASACLCVLRLLHHQSSNDAAEAYRSAAGWLEA